MNYRLFYKLLHDSENVRNRVDTRIFAENAPAGIKGECIVIRNISGTPNLHLLNESDVAQPMVQIDFYAASATQARSGYELVRMLLSGLQRTEVLVLDDEGADEIIIVQSCVLRRPGALVDEPRDASDQWVYRYSADFEAFHTQRVPTHV